MRKKGEADLHHDLEIKVQCVLCVLPIFEGKRRKHALFPEVRPIISAHRSSVILRSERLKEDVVHIAVAPILTRLERFNDRMVGEVEVFGRVLIP
jgi:hypothetical protein